MVNNHGSMVSSRPLRIGLWDPFPMAFLWFINGGDPNRGCRFIPEKHVRKQSATDGFSGDLNIGETRVWRLDSGPNLQPCKWAT